MRRVSPAPVVDRRERHRVLSCPFRSCPLRAGELVDNAVLSCCPKTNVLSGKRVGRMQQGISVQAGNIENSAASPVETPRVGELDAQRGLAALGVVAFHYTTFYQQEQGHLQPLGFGFPAGNYGERRGLVKRFTFPH